MGKFTATGWGALHVHVCQGAMCSSVKLYFVASQHQCVCIFFYLSFVFEVLFFPPICFPTCACPFWVCVKEMSCFLVLFILFLVVFLPIVLLVETKCSFSSFLVSILLYWFVVVIFLSEHDFAVSRLKTLTWPLGSCRIGKHCWNCKYKFAPELYFNCLGCWTINPHRQLVLHTMMLGELETQLEYIMELSFFIFLVGMSFSVVTRVWARVTKLGEFASTFRSKATD